MTADDPTNPAARQPARDHLVTAAPAIARRIRSLRREDDDWSMRTSDLLSSTMRRVLQITDHGERPITAPSFWTMIDAAVRSVVVDGIRRRTVRRRALGILRDHARSRGQGAGDHAEAGLVRDDARALLDALTDDERLLIRLRLGGMDWAQVADAMGTSPPAARQRWSALRRKARAIAEGADAAEAGNPALAPAPAAPADPGASQKPASS